MKHRPASLFKRFIAGMVDLGIVSLLVYAALLLLMLLLLVLGGALFAGFIGFFMSFADSGGWVAPVARLLALAQITPMTLLLGLAVILTVVTLLGVIWHGYFIYFECRHGATPGKKIMGLKVISLEGSPLTLAQATYRDLLRWYFDFFLIIPAIVAILLTKNRQRVGDLVANTMVVDVFREDEDARQHFIAAQVAHAPSPKENPQPIDEVKPTVAAEAQVPTSQDQNSALQRYLDRQKNLSEHVEAPPVSAGDLASVPTNSPETEVHPTLASSVPAGFWLRAVALVIDMVILSILKKLLVGWVGDGLLNFYAVDLASSLVLIYLYFGWFYARRGATPGKMAMGLKVVSSKTGRPLSYTQTFLRETCGKIISLISLIGFFLAAFTKNKTALHDIICHTSVVRER